MYFYALPASMLAKVSSQTSVDVSTQTEWDRLMIVRNLVIIARSFKSIVTEGNPLGQSKAAKGYSLNLLNFCFNNP